MTQTRRRTGWEASQWLQLLGVGHAAVGVVLHGAALQNMLRRVSSTPCRAAVIGRRPSGSWRLRR